MLTRDKQFFFATYSLEFKLHHQRVAVIRVTVYFKINVGEIFNFCKTFIYIIFIHIQASFS